MKRYDVVFNNCDYGPSVLSEDRSPSASMEPKAAGRFCLYEDHDTALAAERKRADEAERLLRLAAKGLKPHGFGASVLTQIEGHFANAAETGGRA